MTPRARTAALGAALALLAGCEPQTPQPTAASGIATAIPALPAPPATEPAPLADRPPLGAYAAEGHAPGWRAQAADGRLHVHRAGERELALDVAIRAYARGLEFEGVGATGRVTLSISSDVPCADPPAYAATLLVAGQALRGCATPQPQAPPPVGVHSSTQ